MDLIEGNHILEPRCMNVDYVKEVASAADVERGSDCEKVSGSEWI